MAQIGERVNRPLCASKPCGRIGCDVPIVTPGPRSLARRQFCSRKCQYLHRVANGWRPHLTEESRRKGGQKGGRVAGEKKRRRAMLRAAEATNSRIPRAILDALSPQQQALMKVLFVRVARKFYRRGYQTGWHGRQAQKQEIARLQGMKAKKVAA